MEVLLSLVSFVAVLCSTSALTVAVSYNEALFLGGSVGQCMLISAHAFVLALNEMKFGSCYSITLQNKRCI